MPRWPTLPFAVTGANGPGPGLSVPSPRPSWAGLHPQGVEPDFDQVAGQSPPPSPHGRSQELNAKYTTLVHVLARCSWLPASLRAVAACSGLASSILPPDHAIYLHDERHGARYGQDLTTAEQRRENRTCKRRAAP
jgi:hypothetical protein